MSRLGAAAAVVLLLLLPPGAAAAGAPGASASALQVTGTADVQGVSTVLDSAAGPAAGIQATLAAAAWDLATVTSDGLALSDLAVFRNGTEAPKPTHAAWSGDLQAAPWSKDARLFVAAPPRTHPTVATSFQSARVTAPAADCLERPVHFLGHDPGPCIPATETHAIRSLDRIVAVHWTGPITVQLWGWNLTGADGATAWSGSLRRPASADAPQAPVWSDTSQVLTLTTAQADAWFFLPGDATVLACAESAWAIEGLLVVQDAAGREREQRSGEQALHVKARSGPEVPYTLDAAGQAPLSPLAAAGWGLTAAGAVALAALAAGLAAWRRRSAPDLYELLEADDPREAARAARRPKAGKQAAILRTIAFIRSREPDAAEAVLARQQGSDPLDAADHAFLLACIRALQGRAQEAAAAVRACLAASPGYAQEVRGTPILRGLLDATEEGYA